MQHFFLTFDIFSIKYRNMAPQQRQILAQLASKYLETFKFVRSTSPHTVNSYTIDLRQFLEFVGIRKIYASYKENQSIQPLDSDSLFKEINGMLSTWAKHSPATKNRKFSTLRAFMKWLFQEGYINKDLAARIPSPKVPFKLPNYLSVDEALCIFNFLQKSTYPRVPRDLALFTILYGCGLRVSEACTSRWSELDASQKCLKVMGKGGRERIVALPQVTLDSINRLKREGDYIFGKKPLNPRTAYAIIRNLSQKSGIVRPISPHTLRHSFATHLLKGGSHLRAIQEILGHKTLATTQRYTHLDLDSLYTTLAQKHPLSKRK